MYHRKIATALLAISLLTGCAQAGLYQSAIKDAAKEAKDLEADTIVSASCLVGIGALGRLENRAWIVPVLDICFPAWRDVLAIESARQE